MTSSAEDLVEDVPGLRIASAMPQSVRDGSLSTRWAWTELVYADEPLTTRVLAEIMACDASTAVRAASALIASGHAERVAIPTAPQRDAIALVEPPAVAGDGAPERVDADAAVDRQALGDGDGDATDALAERALGVDPEQRR